MPLPLTWLDVFTEEPLAGNALAVVHDADGLDDATMLRVARETRLSETTFLQTDPDAEADYVCRIWTMGGELAFAGHPTLGSAVAVARRRGLEAAELVQRSTSGLVRVEVALGSDGVWRGSMLQAPATWGEQVDAVLALGAAGLPAELAAPGLPCQVVSTGLRHLVAPVADPAALDAIDPAPEAVAALLDDLGCTCLYLAAVDLEAGTAQARGLFVDPGALTEDPATGSAAGPLAAHVAAHGGPAVLRVHQGVAMGRPSLLECEVLADGVRVGGACVPVLDGTLAL